MTRELKLPEMKVMRGIVRHSDGNVQAYLKKDLAPLLVAWLCQFQAEDIDGNIILYIKDAPCETMGWSDVEVAKDELPTEALLPLLLENKVIGAAINEAQQTYFQEKIDRANSIGRMTKRKRGGVDSVGAQKGRALAG